MATDQGPIVQGAMLRAELLQLRRDRGLTQEQVAHSLDWHPSKLIRIEGGKSRLTKTDLQALLREYGVTSESRQERLEELREGTRSSAWWDEFRDDLDEATFSFVGHEAGASVVRQFENALIPGLLQTREYATVVVSNFVGSSGTKRLVTLRMRRQEAMRVREQPPRRHFIMDEAAIRRHIGVHTDPRIMSRQLRHIIDRIDTDEQVSVRIVPFSAGAHPGVGGPFVLLEFDRGPADALYIEGPDAVNTRSTFTRDSDAVSDYRYAFETLAEDALSAPDSAGLIAMVADELEASG